MPANPERHIRTWDPRPFPQPHSFSAAESTPYTIEDEAGLAVFIEHHADLPELEVYNWLGPKAKLAQDLATTLFRPVYAIGIDARVIVQAHVEGVDIFPNMEPEPDLKLVDQQV